MIKILRDITLLVLINFPLICSAQGNNFMATNVYEGYIHADKQKLIINLNFLLLIDSTMVGSYYYNAGSGSLKLTGKLHKDLTFDLNERNQNDEITGYFHGKLNKGFKSAYGKWEDAKNKKQFDFVIKKSAKESYWDYIKKNRALFEHHDISKAIKNANKILSIDVANQQLSTLPLELSKLKKIVSINLSGNSFLTFPPVLGKLTSLDEISLSSNKLENIGPEIGTLKNLRILILNFNQLKELPKEIGNLTDLLYLELGRNNLSHLTDTIKNLTELQELHIENNKLSDIEKQSIKQLLPNCVIHF